MPTGKVKWFDKRKGFGFITPNEGEKDIFVHQSDIVKEGFRALEEEQLVEYDIGEGEKGARAIDVKPVNREK